MKNKINIVVWRDYGDGYPDGRIIKGVYGDITLVDFEDIQNGLNDPDCDVEIPQDGDTFIIGTVCSVHWNLREIQYGTGYGDVHTFDGYWYFNIVGYIVSSWDTDTTGRVVSDELKITEYTCEEFAQHFKYD